MTFLVAAGVCLLLAYLVWQDTQRILKRRDAGPLCSDEHSARLSLRVQRSVFREPK